MSNNDNQEPEETIIDAGLPKQQSEQDTSLWEDKVIETPDGEKNIRAELGDEE